MDNLRNLFSTILSTSLIILKSNFLLKELRVTKLPVLFGTLFFLFSNPIFAKLIYPCNGAIGSIHVNQDGTPGGFVASTATVDSTISLTPESQVCERATVIEGVKLTDRAKISGKATVRGKVLVAGRAQIFGEAYIVNPLGDEMIINENVKIFGNAFIQGSVVVSGTSEVFGWGKVLEFAQVLGATKICGGSIVKGFDVLTDNTDYCIQK